MDELDRNLERLRHAILSRLHSRGRNESNPQATVSSTPRSETRATAPPDAGQKTEEALDSSSNGSGALAGNHRWGPRRTDAADPAIVEGGDKAEQKSENTGSIFQWLRRWIGG